MFTRKDLQLGDVVVDRRGVAALVARVHSNAGRIFLSNHGFMPSSYFTEDLLSNSDSDFDIMKVYRSHSGWGHGFQEKLRRLVEVESQQHACIFDRDAGRQVEIDGKTYSLADVKRALAHEDVKSVEEEDDDDF